MLNKLIQEATTGRQPYRQVTDTIIVRCLCDAIVQIQTAQLDPSEPTDRPGCVPRIRVRGSHIPKSDRKLAIYEIKIEVIPIN